MIYVNQIDYQVPVEVDTRTVSTRMMRIINPFQQFAAQQGAHFIFYYYHSFALLSNSPASGCRIRFSNPCRNRQPVRVPIQWTFRHGECRTHHLAKESLWGCILPMSGWHGTSTHRPNTDAWNAKARCFPRWIDRKRHSCRPKRKTPCLTLCRSCGGGYVPAVRSPVR